MSPRNAFTLVELLVVLTIIAILAALLFPVFSHAREGVRQTACASNFKQQYLAFTLYQQDYDELTPIIFYGDGTWNSPPTQLYFQILAPFYTHNTALLHCPSDPANERERETSGMPAVGTNSNQRAFNLGMKNNFGYNWQYLCPVGDRADGSTFSIPTSLADIGVPSKTIFAADSIWGLNDNGLPVGGGTAAVDPPCRNYSDGTDSFPAPNGFQDRFSWGGWHPSHPQWSNVYGYAWPWHNKRATVVFCDGHTKALTIDALAAGCDVKDAWGGVITDPEKYLWDLR